MGCLLWMQHLFNIQPQFLQLFLQYLTILDRVITALDCIWTVEWNYLSTPKLQRPIQLYPHTELELHHCNAWCHENAFHVTDPLGGENLPLTGEFTSQLASNAEHVCFQYYEPEQGVKQTIKLPLMCDTVTIRLSPCNRPLPHKP